MGFRGGAFGAVRLLGQLVAPRESLALGGGFEEGLAGSVIVVGAGEADERLRGCGGVDGCGRVGEHAGKRQRGTAGNHGFRVIGDDGLVVGEVEALLENAYQRGVERERAAFEDDGRAHVDALCQAAERLLGDGMEGRQGQVVAGCPLIEQGLDVGFGVYAAATGDVVDRASAAGGGIEPLDGQVEHRGDFVDERARAARAAAVHAHIGDVERAGGLVGAEEDHLGVLAAKLDSAARTRVERLDSAGVGDDLLHERHAKLVGDGRRAGAGERKPDAGPRE